MTVAPPDAFGPALDALTGPVRLDKGSVPLWVVQRIEAAGIAHHWGEDPCIRPKARKTHAEIAATRAAHLRDGAAVCECLAWFDTQPPGTITEIDVVTHLEACRAATGELRDISFDTIAGSGPHGALPHYRVSEASNRTLTEGDLLVLDSGGQYLDGTTDVTRTLPVGTPGRRGTQRLHPRAAGHDRDLAAALSQGAGGARSGRHRALSAVACRSRLRPRHRAWRGGLFLRA